MSCAQAVTAAALPSGQRLGHRRRHLVQTSALRALINYVYPHQASNQTHILRGGGLAKRRRRHHEPSPHHRTATRARTPAGSRPTVLAAQRLSRSGDSRESVAFRLSCFPVGDHLMVTWRELTADDDALAPQELEPDMSRFRLLAEYSFDMVIGLDSMGGISYASQSAAAAFGRELHLLIGTEWQARVHPADRPLMTQFIARTMNESRHQDATTIRLTDAGGGYAWWSMTGRRVLTARSFAECVLSLRNVHQQVGADQQVRHDAHLLRGAMNAAPMGMALVGLDRRFIETNPALRQMLGYTSEELTALTVADILSPADSSTDWAMRFDANTSPGSTQIKDLVLVRSDGSEFWASHSIVLILDEYGAPDCYMSHFVDVHESRSDWSDLLTQANGDSLTGLLNRRGLSTQLDALLAQVPRTGSLVAVLFIDVDRLKPVNDLFGHAAGDDVLRYVAHSLNTVLREGDIVARLGGDEFVLALSGVSSASDADVVAERIHHLLLAPLTVDHATITVTVSIGLVVLSPGMDGAESLRQADLAAYRAKSQGGGRTARYDTVLDEPDGVASPDTGPAPTPAPPLGLLP